MSPQFTGGLLEARLSFEDYIENVDYGQCQVNEKRLLAEG